MSVHELHPNLIPLDPAAMIARQLTGAETGLKVRYALCDADARELVAEAVVNWIAPLLAAEENPDAAARDFCRDVLCQVQMASIARKGAVA